MSDFFVSKDYKDYVLTSREIQERKSLLIDNRPDLIHNFSLGEFSACIMKRTKGNPADAPFSIMVRCHPTMRPYTTHWKTFAKFRNYQDAMICFGVLVTNVIQELI